MALRFRSFSILPAATWLTATTPSIRAWRTCRAPTPALAPGHPRASCRLPVHHGRLRRASIIRSTTASSGKPGWRRKGSTRFCALTVPLSDIFSRPTRSTSSIRTASMSYAMVTWCNTAAPGRCSASNLASAGSDGPRGSRATGSGLSSYYCGSTAGIRTPRP